MKKNVYILLFVFFSLTFSAGKSFAQSVFPPTQLAPANGTNGIRASASGSYIMIWSSLPNAVAYQWVNSNNHLCFLGCPGDTRTETTADTNTIVYNIPVNEWRYWIVRAFLSNGDTTASTPIFSFLPKKDGTETPLFSIVPNPAKEYITVSVDWFSNPQLNKIIYTVIDLYGKTLVANKEYVLAKDPFIRNEKHTLELPPLSPGIYSVIITLDYNNRQFIEKVVVL